MDLSQLPEIEAQRLPAISWLARQLARLAHMRRRFGIRYLGTAEKGSDTV